MKPPINKCPFCNINLHRFDYSSLYELECKKCHEYLVRVKWEDDSIYYLSIRSKELRQRLHFYVVEYRLSIINDYNFDKDIKINGFSSWPEIPDWSDKANIFRKINNMVIFS